MSKRFLLAPDSFKESATAKDIADAMEKGILKVFPDASITKVPMADGGEGTVQSLIDATDGQLIEKEVHGPLGNKVKATYGILGDNETAVIEMASAIGLHLVAKEERDPFKTTTYGTGELIKDCLDRGIKKIIIGIGGSATNDGGAGMAKALGVKFLDSNHNELNAGGKSLIDLDSIELSNLHPGIDQCKIVVASDVSNPLTGKEGASAVFGPQKGATNDMVQDLDKSLSHYAGIIESDLHVNIDDVPGSGAAGGLGAGLLTFTNATLDSGIDIVIEHTKLEEKLKNIDYCFTGEGQIDYQTKFGKTPFGVMRVAKYTDPETKVIALAGTVGKDVDELYKEGFNGIFSITPGASTIDELLETTLFNVERTTEAICRVLK